MNNPDFSSSPEHVALAKTIVDAWQRWWRLNHEPFDSLPRAKREEWLVVADAAMTHLGSGYRLPEANEANAERLAKAKYEIDYPRLAWFFDASEDQRRVRKGDALRYLRALRDVFGEPDKPEQCNCADCSPANWPDTNGWRCGKKKPEPRPYPPCPTPCGEAKFIPPSGARPDGSLVTHVVPPTPEADSPADPTVCRPGCDRKFGHPGPHSDEMQEEIIPRRVIFTALASNPHLMEVLMDMERREDRVACIQRWASIFEEAACRK